MTLTDTGPLVAMLDARDNHHARAKATIKDIAYPLLTTEACLTECLYLLYADYGWRGQAALWRLINIGALRILTPPHDGPDRARIYMDRFQDQPCDYADATILVAAEDLGHRRVFTFDRHFYAYRLTDRTALEVIG